MEELVVRQAGSAGLQSLETLIGIFSAHPHRTPPYSATDYAAVADITINNFKKFISYLDRSSTGHARFRRGPISNPTLPPEVESETVYSTPPIHQRVPEISSVKSGSFEKRDIPATTINDGSGGGIIGVDTDERGQSANPKNCCGQTKT